MSLLPLQQPWHFNEIFQQLFYVDPRAQNNVPPPANNLHSTPHSTIMDRHELLPAQRQLLCCQRLPWPCLLGGDYQVLPSQVLEGGGYCRQTRVRGGQCRHPKSAGTCATVSASKERRHISKNNVQANYTTHYSHGELNLLITYLRGELHERPKFSMYLSQKHHCWGPAIALCSYQIGSPTLDLHNQRQLVHAWLRFLTPMGRGVSNSRQQQRQSAPGHRCWGPAIALCSYQIGSPTPDLHNQRQLVHAWLQFLTPMGRGLSNSRQQQRQSAPGCNDSVISSRTANATNRASLIRS